MKKRVTIGKIVRELEQKTGRKIELKPYYSEKRHKWTVKAVYKD